MNRWRLIAAVVGSSVAASSFGQVMLGQIDDFQDGTLQGWAGAANPENVATGGPAGAGDRYLRLTAHGNIGIGGVPASFNLTQWAGDYSAAGVSGVTAHMNNFSSVDLHMRVVVFSTSGDRWTSATPVILPAGSGWQSASFSLAQGDLVQVLGSSTYEFTMANVERLLIRHEVNPGPGGTFQAGQIGIDNIQAVPEPASLAAMALACAFLRRPRRV
jgi:hypothetical protein